MPTNDVWQLSIRGTVNTQEHICTHHFRDKTGLAAPTAIITVWQAGCQSEYRAMFASADSPILDFTVRQVCGTPPFAATGAAVQPGASQAGTASVSGDPQPSWLARVISWRTAFAGQRYRGRSYIGGLWELWTFRNDLQPSQITISDAYIARMLAVFGPTGSSADWAHVVYSQTLRDTGATCLLSANQVTGGISRVAVGSMKSRRPGSGA